MQQAKNTAVKLVTMCDGEWGSWGDGLGFVGCWGE